MNTFRILRVVSFVLLTQHAYAFEGISSSGGVSGSLFNGLFKVTASSFDNVYSQSQSFSTAAEFRSVKCEKAIKDGDELKHINLGIVKIDEVVIQEATSLVRKIDNIQYSLCRSMVADGKSSSFTLTVGTERNKVLRLGKLMERNLSNPTSANSFSQEVMKLNNELSSR